MTVPGTRRTANSRRLRISSNGRPGLSKRCRLTRASLSVCDIGPCECGSAREPITMTIAWLRRPGSTMNGCELACAPLTHRLPRLRLCALPGTASPRIGTPQVTEHASSSTRVPISQISAQIADLPSHLYLKMFCWVGHLRPAKFRVPNDARGFRSRGSWRWQNESLGPARERAGGW